MSATMTIRLGDEVKARHEKLAGATQRILSRRRSDSRLPVETNEWQIGELRKALEEADAGDFASDEQVRAFARKWKVNAR